VNLALVEVDSRGVETGLAELHGKRQSHVPEPDDAGARAAGLDLLQQ
jgi:hypothetical protein